MNNNPIWSWLVAAVICITLSRQISGCVSQHAIESAMSTPTPVIEADTTETEPQPTNTPQANSPSSAKGAQSPQVTWLLAFNAVMDANNKVSPIMLGMLSEPQTSTYDEWLEAVNEFRYERDNFEGMVVPPNCVAVNRVARQWFAEQDKAYEAFEELKNIVLNNPGSTLYESKKADVLAHLDKATDLQQMVSQELRKFAKTNK